MFRMLVQQALNNLSDEQVDIRCATGCRSLALLGLAIEGSIPEHLRGQGFQAIIGIEKSRLGIIPAANQNLTNQIRTAREKELFFEVPKWRLLSPLSAEINPFMPWLRTKAR
jgi:hypothetical protein